MPHAPKQLTIKLTDWQAHQIWDAATAVSDADHTDVFILAQPLVERRELQVLCVPRGNLLAYIDELCDRTAKMLDDYVPPVDNGERAVAELAGADDA